MKKSAYICNANTTQRVVEHTDNTAISVFPCGISAPRRCVVFAKLTKEIRSLFVLTRKTCYTMRTPNKQAIQAKNSNLSQKKITTLIVLGTLVISTLLLIFAPEILLAFGKFLGCVALTAMAVVPMLYSLIYEPYEKR